MSSKKAQARNRFESDRRKARGSALIYFCVVGLALSSAVKFVHPAPVVAYMASMGYEGGKLFVVAGLELFCAVMFWLRSTRSLGLLLVSSYFGGAIAAHLAYHPHIVGGPFLTYMLSHPYTGALEPGVFLAAAWVGTWLCYPAMFAGLDARSERREVSPLAHTEMAMNTR